MRKCKKCCLEKDLTFFSQRQTRCKECNNELARGKDRLKTVKLVNSGGVIRKSKYSTEDGKKTCKVCLQRKDLTHFHKGKLECKCCRSATRKGERLGDLINHRLQSLKARAKQNNVPFSLKEEDLNYPDTCPILGIPLLNTTNSVGNHIVTDNTPTVDKIVPALGYVKGNIVIVSHRANRIKNNATIDELVRIAEFYKNLTSTKEGEQ